MVNIWDAVIIVLVGAGAVLAVRHMRKNRKDGKCPGGCDCGCGKPCELTRNKT